MPPSIAPVRHKRLNPQVQIEGVTYIMVTQFVIAVDTPELNSKVDNLDRHYDEIRSAYDMRFNGF